MEMKDRIKKIRKELDLTQQGFAEKIGTTANVLTNYETGRRNPSASVINNICKTFNVNEDWLRTGEGEMFVQRSEEEEIANLVYDLLDPKDDDFYNAILALVQAYSDLNDSSQQVIREMIRGTMKYYKKRKGD